MNDDEIRIQLERRAGAWSAPDLLPGVRNGMAAPTQRTWPANVTGLVGVAAAAAVLVLLVIALPSALPGPNGASPAPSASSGLTVLSTSDFASRLAADQLNRSTVLVDGRISTPADLTKGPPCDGTRFLCPIGLLDGAVPPIAVVARYVAVGRNDEPTVEVSDGWNWWARFSAPTEGTLVLSVDPQRNVEYLGRVLPNGVSLTWSASDASGLDVNTLDLDQVVLVDAWLAGDRFPAPCPSRPADAFVDLPSRQECGLMSWLSDDHTIIDPLTQTAPAHSVHVEADGYTEFVPMHVAPLDNGALPPQRGDFVLARRLFGYGCGQRSVPCWDWSIVQRLASSGQSEIESPTSAPTPMSPSASPLGCGDYTLFDSTSLVAECDSGPVGRIASSVVNPGGDLTQLVVAWASSSCVRDIKLSFDAAESGYLIDVKQGSSEPGCFGGIKQRGAHLVLRRPVAAESVQLSGVSPVSTATVLPTAQSPTPFDCGGSISLTDSTGGVVACTDAGGMDYHSEAAHVSNPNGDPHALHVWWGRNSCANETQIDVSRATDDPNQYLVSINDSVASDCFLAPDAHSVDLRLNVEVPAGDVTLSVAGQNIVPPYPPSGTVLSCGPRYAIWQPTFNDETRLVRSCSSALPTDSSSPVSNPDGDLTRLLVQWYGTDCDAGLTLRFSQVDSGYSLLGFRPKLLCETPLVTHALALTLSQPINAGSIQFQVHE